MTEDGNAANIRPAYAWIIVLSVFSTSGMITNSQIPSGNFLSFLFVGGLVAMPFWVVLTESGAEWAMKAGDNSSTGNNTQSVDLNSSSGDTSICSNCGWQNPHENNFCTDCGSEL
jgi:hypothetical protein